MAGVLDARSFRTMFLSGAQALDAKKDWINELNVFPVPDGDTGTNMTMTIMSAVKEVMSTEEETMEALVKAMSFGALHGARGNSGVILSQLFRGFSKVAREKEEMTIPDIVEAVNSAVDSAYKAVMKPKEGTILTVAKGISEKAQELSDCEDLGEFLRQTIAYGDEVLSKTPEMLPVLKQAGVVDSGGQGLMVILHGVYDAYLGKPVDLSMPELTKKPENLVVDTSEIDTADIKFGYCTEFIVKTAKDFTANDEGEFKGFLESLGDSIVLVADDGLVKVHVHSNNPGLVIEKALTYGELSRMKIDNMREEHQERLFKNAEKLAEEQKKAVAEVLGAPKEPRKDVGFVAVCAGDGLAELFKELGVDYIIEGGQTMNPSTEDVLSAIKKVNADHVFVLPNNKNIVMAANQAAALTEDKEVIVIPSSTICQGISCMLNYVPEMSVEDNAGVMQDSRHNVKTIEVTYAIRDTKIDGVEIHENDFMALGDQGILVSVTDLSKAVKEAVSKCVDEESMMVTLYYGADIQEADAEVLVGELSEAFPNVEVSAVYGGQPVYYYFISVE